MDFAHAILYASESDARKALRQKLALAVKRGYLEIEIVPIKCEVPE